MPAKTPRFVVDRVHAETVKALKNEAVVQRLATSGSQVIGAGPEEFDRLIKSEIARWNRVLTEAGVKPTL